MDAAEDLVRHGIGDRPQARRYTLGVASIIAVAAVVFVGALMLFAGQPEVGDEVLQGDEAGTPPGGPGGVAVVPATNGVYIGYPVDGYDPSDATGYDEAAIAQAIVDWQAANPETPVFGFERVEADDGTLLGMFLRLEP